MSATLDELARALAQVGRSVRDTLHTAMLSAADARIVRRAGGDDIYGLDDRADQVLVAELQRQCSRWPGRLVVEGADQPLPIGERSGPWVYLADPVDGTRLWLTGKRSAWVLLGAGRKATTLEELEVAAAVELPTPRARLGLVAWARKGGSAHAEDDDLVAGGRPLPHPLIPQAAIDITRTYVSFPQYTPGTDAAASSSTNRGTTSVVRAHQHAAGARRQPAKADQEQGHRQEQEQNRGAPRDPDEALGRSRGGLSTKIHLRTEGGGKPMVIRLTGGQAHEAPVLPSLLDAGAVKRPGPTGDGRPGRGRPRLRPKRLAGDKGYSYPSVWRHLRRRGIGAVIPTRSNQRRDPRFDRDAYRERNRVERTFNRLKQYRRVATRYERRGVNYEAMAVIAAIVLV